VPLDPQAKVVLDAMPPMPDFDAIPLELLRAGMAQGTLPGEPERVASVENRTLPGPAGEIPVRIYKPEARGPLPGRATGADLRCASNC
jgi:acetyl esterase